MIPARKSLHWTSHSRNKMRQYGLSEARVSRVLHRPYRVEEGVAEGTAAFMQKAGSEKHPHELWVMIQDTPKTRKIISAWKYPGVTKPRSSMMRDIMKQELAQFGL
jgi:hypothetical protein